MNYQEEYFNAIYSDFQSKVRILAELVRDHPGEYGGVIERAIIELLRMFLPERYSIGSGFVIDSTGNRSRQCDVIIYDALSSFDVFGYGGRFLFPVESVYAIIEVKKTLNKKRVQEACDNIASVRRLESSAPSEHKWEPAEDGTLEYREYYPKPPTGIIFGYRSETRKLITLKGWFEEAFQKIPDTKHHPDLAVSMLEGFKFRYKALGHRIDSQEFKFYPLAMRDTNGNVMRGSDGGATGLALPIQDLDDTEIEYVGVVNGYSYNRHCKFVQHQQGSDIYSAADDARLLMTTLSSIAKLLSLRSSTESLMEAYFSPYFAEAVKIPSS